MKIVLYTVSFLPTIGGREIVIHYLARTLKELGHDVRVVGPAGFLSQRKFRMGYPLHRWPTLWGLLDDRMRMAQLLLDAVIWGCDVIHAHCTYPCGYVAGRLKTFRRIPMVVTPHGEDINMIPEIGFGQRLDPLKRPKIKEALQKADVITAISRTVETSLMQAGAPVERIRRIPNGIDLDRFQKPVACDVPGWLQLPQDSRLILTVGNYRRCKGQESIIEAMPLVLKEDPQARLVVVGKGTEALKPMIATLGLEDRVRLTGRIGFPAKIINGHGSGENQETTDWLAALYQRSQIYISGGMEEGAEGLSLAVLDAMAAGCAIVATDISGNRDVIRHQKTGVLIRPADSTAMAEAIVRLLRNPDMRSRLGAGSRRVAEEFGWSRIASDYVRVYQEARECVQRGRI
ncbi:MAG: glycosyltransferase family 4 protein [Deltaproteobacteria bacterium]|nr:glycosyltransferase family 4 protein [Deltaproteobacteria bacterium]